LSRLALDELLDAVVDAIPDMLPAAEAASLWLHDAERDELVARAWAGHDDEAISGLALPPDTSLVGLVCRSRQPQETLSPRAASARICHPPSGGWRKPLGG
jgi:signal transduction protein with GAF and PtsI domain